MKRHTEVYQREDALFDWRLIGANGEEVASSLQGFTKRSDAEEAARREFPDLPLENEGE